MISSFTEPAASELGSIFVDGTDSVVGLLLSACCLTVVGLLLLFPFPFS